MENKNMEKFWHQKSWQEFNRVQLIKEIARWSELRDWTGWKPEPEEVETYRQMYEKARSNWPDDYTLLGCVLPEKFGEK